MTYFIADLAQVDLGSKLLSLALLLGFGAFAFLILRIFLIVVSKMFSKKGSGQSSTNSEDINQKGV